MRTTTRRAALLGAVALGACTPTADTSRDLAAIEALMRTTWDRPEAPLDAGPIVVEGAHAIADWTQGEMGGRALLEKRDGNWRVVLCAGDALRTAEGIGSVGVPNEAAAALASALESEERNVLPARLEAMSRFASTVRMD